MSKKQFGIRITLPPGDIMASPHLLGPDWEGFRWFDTREERDRAWQYMQKLPPYYRRDEDPTQVLEKIEQEV